MQKRVRFNQDQHTLHVQCLQPQINTGVTSTPANRNCVVFVCIYVMSPAAVIYNPTKAHANIEYGQSFK